jgi:DNA-binding response OmpR family regulator
VRSRVRPHVLVVEDDPKTARIIKLYLEAERFQVSLADEGPAALAFAREQHPDIMLLDLMLPKLDGLALCTKLRQESEIPIIMVTARSTEDDRITGLQAGADDYLIKPFSPRELVARVQAVLRRATDDGSRRRRRFAFDGLELDGTAHSLRVDGKDVRLTPTEFSLLESLCRSAGNAVSRDRLIESAFGVDFDGSPRTIDVHIASLRKKIGDDGDRRFIETVSGIGYRFTARRK